MTLIVHRAPRADLLADGLADLLRDPLEDPFTQELVLVPARGVERWLSQRLSHRLGPADGHEDGVCAGVEFRSPASLVAELVIGDGGTREDDPWSPDALVWPLLSVVDDHAGEEWCRVLSQHLGHGEPGEEGDLRRGRRYAVARRLARLFSSYAVQRPTLLAEWESGRDTDGAGGALDPDLTWQPELWRLLVAQVDAPSPHQRHRDVLEALDARPDEVDLPSRFSLFGHTRIPVTEVELLAALGRHRDVHLWLPHPSAALWDSLTDLAGAVPRSDDGSHERVGHPLLASLGRDLRELERTLVAGRGPLVGRGAASPRPDTLLGWLQHDVAANATVEPVSRSIRPDDDSVQVHACHGPARQVEVLREVVLGLLADDPTLEPRDILVMCPDIEAYAPLVAAAFGMGEIGGHPGHQLRVRLADRSLTQTNPLLGGGGADPRPGRWPGRGEPGARPARRSARAPSLRFLRLRPRDDHRLGGGGRHPVGLRRRPPGALRAAALRPEHLAVRPRPRPRRGRGQRRRRPVLRHDAAARRRRQHQHRPRRSPRRVPRPVAGGDRPARRQPPGGPLAGGSRRRGRPAHGGRAGRRVAVGAGPP